MKQTLLLTLVVALACPAQARLASIPLDHFKEAAPCGLVVEVIKVDKLEPATSANSKEVRRMNRVALAKTVETFGKNGLTCPAPRSPLEFLFSTEIHSSHPLPGDRAVLFLESYDELRAEAVYGRSYWRLRVIDDVIYVEVTWRNSFLISPIGLTGEKAFLPLDAIKREWAG